MDNYQFQKSSNLGAEESAKELERVLTRCREDGWDTQELHRLVRDFVDIAYRLPIRTYDLIGWLAHDDHFSREAIAHFARDHFGMARKSQKVRLAA